MEYKQPETRIKRVRGSDGERFYAQHKQVIIPIIWFEWQNTRPSLLDEHYTTSLEEAKKRIDNFLLKSKAQWEGYVKMKQTKKVKPEVEYIKYP